MKHLGATGVIAEAGPDLYHSTGFSKAMTIDVYADGFPCMYVEHFFSSLFYRLVVQ